MFAARFRLMAGAPWRGRAAARKETFGDAILQRMEGHHGDPPPCPQQLLGGGESAGQFVELLVEVEAERLEGAGGRMLGFVALAAKHARDDFG